MIRVVYTYLSAFSMFLRNCAMFCDIKVAKLLVGQCTMQELHASCVAYESKCGYSFPLLRNSPIYYLVKEASKSGQCHVTNFLQLSTKLQDLKKIAKLLHV